MTQEIETYFDRLWPICRSITGNGLRESFKILQEIIPLQLTEVPSGTQVFDWVVPKEWNITDAYILRPDGKKICDFKLNNLHVVNYSIPVNKQVSLEALKKHLHSIPELPDAIPYITSYYKETWGFCMAYNEFVGLEEGSYTVVIDSSLENGALTYGDMVLKGDTNEEIMFSSYLCHPSMANNELSGPLTLAFLYRKISEMKNRRYTYRFILAPETIGVIAYLAKHGMYMKEKTRAGYVLTCCGNDAPFMYKRSKISNSLADKIALHVLAGQDEKFDAIDFAVGGSDERQYCSPGFNMPVGSVTRSMYQKYKEYHTSLDNKSFISFSALEKTVGLYFDMVKALELNKTFINTIPYCEPQLGKRGLYPNAVGPLDAREFVHDRMHLLTYADGETSLLEIAEKRNASILRFEPHLEPLINAGILKEC